MGFRICIRGDDADADHRVGLLELLRGPELAPVDVERLHQVIGREM